MDIVKSDLLEICNWNSGPSGTGTDYYTLYTVVMNKDLLVVNCSGVQFGWEFDDWELVKKSENDDSLFENLTGNLSHFEKCKLFLAAHRSPISRPK
ncbi:MAG: hypothetical protein ACK40M_10735 [Flavobacteriales bacterium]